MTLPTAKHKNRTHLATDLQPPVIIQPGKFHRFPGLDKKRGDDAGW